MANGMSQPRLVTNWIDGLDRHALPYDELDQHKPFEQTFENKSVLIMGAGNAALETADAIRDYARDIQVVTSNTQKLSC